MVLIKPISNVSQLQTPSFVRITNKLHITVSIITTPTYAQFLLKVILSFMRVTIYIIQPVELIQLAKRQAGTDSFTFRSLGVIDDSSH
jgi:hypothetical protein